MSENEMSLRQKLKQQEREIKKRLFGMDEEIKIFCLSKAADLTLLMIGPHGIAKSTLARFWSQTAGLSYRIVTSSEVDDALIAYIDPATFRAENRVQMKRGELMTIDSLLIDEFFLWSPRYRARLHQLLEEGSYAGLSVLTKTYTFATNPLSEHYSGQMSELNMATMDRIDLLLPMYQANITSTQRMLRKFSKFGRRERALDQVISWDDYLSMRDEILRVEIPTQLIVWLTLFAEELACCRYMKSKFEVSRARMRMKCAECNRKEHICARVACSKPRLLRACSLLAKSLAWYRGAKIVRFDDIQEAIKFTLPHRMVLLGKEASVNETQQEISNIITMFNEGMELIRNRNVFNILEKVYSQAQDPNNPEFLQEDANNLRLELQEDLPYLNYANELIDVAKKRVKRHFKQKSRAIKAVEIGSFRDVLDKSGLDIHDKKEILEDIEDRLSNFVISHNLNKLRTKEVTAFAFAIHRVHQMHNLTCESPKDLIPRFQKEVKLNSELMDISEDIEGRSVTIACSSEKVKRELEKELGE